VCGDPTQDVASDLIAGRRVLDRTQKWCVVCGCVLSRTVGGTCDAHVATAFRLGGIEAVRSLPMSSRGVLFSE
jgi:hypothetical protein